MTSTWREPLAVAPAATMSVTTAARPLDVIFIEGFVGQTIIGIYDGELHEPSVASAAWMVTTTSRDRRRPRALSARAAPSEIVSSRAEAARKTIEQRPSKGGNYLGLTITITATSREQLDEIYRTLTTHPMVKVVL